MRNKSGLENVLGPHWETHSPPLHIFSLQGKAWLKLTFLKTELINKLIEELNRNLLIFTFCFYLTCYRLVILSLFTSLCDSKSVVLFFFLTKGVRNIFGHYSLIISVRGIIHPEMKVCWKCTHPQAIQNVDEFFLIGIDLEKCNISALTLQWIHCSEWVPSEWELKQLIKKSLKWIIHKIMSKVKSCLRVRN